MSLPSPLAFKPDVPRDAEIVGRLAPSPTGRLHLGHARSFIAAWWHARAAGGRVVLRSEDLDRTRCKPEFEDAFLRDLEWLGLTWDGPLLRQSAAGRAVCAALASLGLPVIGDLERGGAGVPGGPRVEPIAPDGSTARTHAPAHIRKRFSLPAFVNVWSALRVWSFLFLPVISS